MIRVEQAPEPSSFDMKVRQPGLRAIAEMVGEPNLPKRPGPKRKVIAASREEIDLAPIKLAKEKKPGKKKAALPDVSGVTEVTPGQGV